MIRGNAEPDEAEGNRQSLVHIHMTVLELDHHPVGRVESCRAGTDNRHPEWAIRLLWNIMLKGTPGTGACEPLPQGARLSLS